MRIIHLSFLFLILSFTSVAQVILPVSIKQYADGLEGAAARTERTLHRSVTEKTWYKDRKIVQTEINTIESFPNGDSRGVMITTVDGKPTEKVQRILLGNFMYRKQDDAPWIKECYRDCPKQSLVLTLESEDRDSPKLEAFSTSIPAERSQLIGYFLYRVTDVGDTLNFLDSKVWVGAKGLLQKIEDTYSTMYPENNTSTEVRKYEYEPKDILPLKAPVE